MTKLITNINFNLQKQIIKEKIDKYYDQRLQQIKFECVKRGYVFDTPLDFIVFLRTECSLMHIEATGQYQLIIDNKFTVTWFDKIEVGFNPVDDNNVTSVTVKIG